jgi:multidrug resistance efflux pump
MEPIQSSSSPARRWRLSIPISLGVLLLSASLIVAVLSLRSHAGSPSAPVTDAKPADDASWYALGYVDIEGGYTSIYPLQPGRVQRIYVKENDFLKKGQPIFQLENTVPLFKVRAAEKDLRAAQDKLTIAEAQVKKADAEIAAQKVVIAVAQKNVKKAQILRDKEKGWVADNIATKDAAQVAQITVEQAEEGVKAAQAKLAVIEAGKREAEGYVAAARTNMEFKQIQIEEAQNAVNECVVRAPVDGKPLRINVNVGEVLGSNPHQAAVQFAAEGPRLVRAEVEQEFVGRVRPDQNVIIKDYVSGQECASGKVASIAQWYAPRRGSHSELAPLNNDNRTLECIIKLDSSAPQLRIDQRVRVQFTD